MEMLVRIKLLFSLLACLFVTTFLMHSWIDKRGLFPAQKQRGLASVEKGTATVPLNAQGMEDFIYNVLKGKYGIYLQEGQIYHLELSESSPLYIDSLQEFLYEHYQFFQLPAPMKFNLTTHKSQQAKPKRHPASYSAFQVKQYNLWHEDSGEPLGHVLLGHQKGKQALLQIVLQSKHK